ncbi:alpha-mannosidase [Striga asiatica]|uniref:Alpha-mannosidase n=1 Tax=Striga asiatica TaxID=4170 RepID=A0A5A7QL46_STRAF|nr:alpha-mannosidase [Striga asiatica]
MAGFKVFSVTLTVCVLCVLVECKYMVYNTSQGIVPGKINVHLVPHTHDDVGWLKTVDQYYVGSNNSIQIACVQNVLDSLIPALLADKNRKFIYVEQAFFQRWWRNQNDDMKKTVRNLVNSGQLELINGGMCMHDEATTHYIDMIDQTTLGHRFIKDEFNVLPRIGWQIDPFGHSAVQAYLLGAEVGFDALYFARIDYQDRAKRRDEKKLEVVWQGSKSRGSSSQIFTGAFYAGNYEPPTGFYYEINDDSPIVQDDINLFDYNVEERVNAFVAAALAQANVTRSNHVMWTMGTDFKYQYAETWFRNMDKLIHYVNQDGRVNALYSSPSIYTDTKYALNESWPLKTDDYFPYADRINAYWTGYFTSRPAIKGYVRAMSGYYLAARQLELFRGRNKLGGPTTDSLADALAIAQHHDAVTGTEKQHVANDYAKRLSIGYKESEDIVAASLDCLTQSDCKSPCPLLNISYCPATEVDLSRGKKIAVVVYNSLGWKRSDIVKIPVISENVTVRDSTGKLVSSQLIPIVDVSAANRKFYTTAYTDKSPSTDPKYWLSFTAVVPPLGFSTYVISSSKSSGLIEPVSYMFDGSSNGPIQIGPSNLKLIYSANDGKLIRYVNSRNMVHYFETALWRIVTIANLAVNASVEQSYSYYAGDDGSTDLVHFQASGAYVFRPNGTYAIQPDRKVPLTVFRGPLFDEVHQAISPWIYQVTRVYKEKEHVEVEFTVGPIPVDDRVGKEIVTQIKTDIRSNRTFYTDSNGRDFLQRVRDYRTDWDLQVNQPIAGNYYPINLGIYIKDENTEFSILVDRSVGGSSITDGEIEIMLHRRLLHDDGRGVAEALNETVCVLDKCTGLTVKGKYYVKIDPLGEGSKWRRSFGQQIYSPFLLASGEKDAKWTNFPISTFSAMDPSYSLPDNVAIITLQELEDGAVLLRLAHLYEINSIKEMSLSANQERQEMESKRLSWKVEGSKAERENGPRGRPVDPVKLVVEIAPMEIRTFTINFSSGLVKFR